ncbi:hypothetical protein DENIT_90162 [Pseudomonas veronii]|nr:hypothetical protein DENIT_90162 [Pseudomonas veronii]
MYPIIHKFKNARGVPGSGLST